MAGNNSHSFLRYFSWVDCLYSDKRKPTGLSADAFICRESDRGDGLSFFIEASGLDTKKGLFLFQQVGPRDGKDCCGVARVNFGSAVGKGKCKIPRHLPDEGHFGKLHHVIPCPDDDQALRDILSASSTLLRYIQKPDPDLVDLEQFKITHNLIPPSSPSEDEQFIVSDSASDVCSDTQRAAERADIEESKISDSPE